jgi:flagellar M-ring protein FliF
LERDLLQMLEASVGAGNARVKVTLVVSDDQVVRQERVVDPDRRALATSDSTQTSEQGSSASGVVTVASNLPEGDAGTSTAPERSSRNESSESVRYEISEVKTEMVTLPGALRQVQVAVLINEASAAGENGASASAPRSEAELETIRKLVAAAIGYNESRGDVVTVQSLPFERIEPAGTEANNDFIADVLQPNLIPALQLIIPALVTLVLALFVVRPLLAGDGGATSSPQSVAAAPVLVPESSSPQALARPQAAPIDELQRLAAEEQGAASAVLKSWLEQSEGAR